MDAAILGLELGLDLFGYGSETLHDACTRVLCFAYRNLRWAVRVIIFELAILEIWFGKLVRPYF